MTLPGCYNPTVNESETITEAQPFSSVRSRRGTREPLAFGFRGPAAPHIERS